MRNRFDPIQRRAALAAVLALVLLPAGCAELPKEVAYSVRRTAPIAGPRTAISGTARCGAHVTTEVEGVADQDAGAAAWLRRAEKACGGETSAASALTPQVVGNLWEEPGKGAAQ